MSELAEKRKAEYGYHVAGGKALRMQQWHERKDERTFLALVNRLRALNWQRALYRSGGDALDALRARKAAWARKRSAELRDVRLGLVTTCARPGCGATWCRLPNVSGRHLVFCSRQCQRFREWLRLREKTLQAARKACKRCGGTKAPGQGARYCRACKPRASSEARA